MKVEVVFFVLLSFVVFDFVSASSYCSWQPTTVTNDYHCRRSLCCQLWGTNASSLAVVSVSASSSRSSGEISYGVGPSCKSTYWRTEPCSNTKNCNFNVTTVAKLYDYVLIMFKSNSISGTSFGFKEAKITFLDANTQSSSSSVSCW